MKKIFTFNNFLAALGIMTFFFFFTPCFEIKENVEGASLATVNIFKATFGGTLYQGDFYSPIYLIACGAMITAFIFAIVAIVLNLSKNFIRGGSFLAAPFYIASGIIFCCAHQIVYTTNVNIGLPGGVPFLVTPWLYVIAAFFISIGGLCIVDGLASFIKPKEKEVY